MASFTSFCRHKGGVALMEFALALPILVLLFLGALELTLFAIAQQKNDKIAFTMSDLVTQKETITCAELDQYATAVQQIMRPFTFYGTVIFSSVATLQNPPDSCARPTDGSDPMCVTWQHNTIGGDPSQVGVRGGNATPLGDYKVQPLQNVIITEVYYLYRPLFPWSRYVLGQFSGDPVNIINDSLMIYKTAMYKPRQGTLTTIDCDD